MATGRNSPLLGTGNARHLLLDQHGRSSSFPTPRQTDRRAWHVSASHDALAALSSRGGPEEPIEKLKQRARLAIPSAKAQINAWNQDKEAPTYWSGTLKFGADASARNSIYSASWHLLRPDRGRYWFQAATMVTGAGGIKSMEGPLASIGARLPFVPPNARDLAFVLAGNSFLFPYNLHNFYLLRQNAEIPGFERFRGRELDRGLVVIEQTLVQSFADSYSWNDPQEKVESFRRLSLAFSSWVTNRWTKAAVEQLFSEESFDFGNINHRIRLGIETVDKLRSLL